MEYKEALYKKYVSTHRIHRMGGGRLAKQKYKSMAFKQHFGHFLPSNLGAKIADLGCGAGDLIGWLNQSGYSNTLGVDGSIEQVNEAHSNGIVTVVEGDVFSFLSNNTDFDVLFARDLIEHFEEQAVFDFLEQCFSCLSVNGVLVLQVPNAESPYFGRVRYGDFTHELAFTASSMTQLLSAVGFESIEVHPWRPAITGIRSFIRYIIWRLIEPIIKFPIWIESGSTNRIVTMNLIAISKKSKQ